MGMKVDGRQLHHLCFADDIVLITPRIRQAERMLDDFDCVCGNVGLQLNLTKTMFMKNGRVSDVSLSLNGANISECFSCVYLDREVNMANVLASELHSRKRAAWRAFKSVEEVVKRTKTVRFRAQLFNSTVLPALTYALETWAIRNHDQRRAAWNLGNDTRSDRIHQRERKPSEFRARCKKPPGEPSMLA
ncbi:unnamed protein product [Heligmosomoides polygyrus]|uniref:Reverse transcriptase domain-containing protein n=1 Tax=Heligmosomoides polygyrus TaxID=6339 RepID=A0A183FMH3_HELPZ|nr:unnamed protein product [Heligmosomoides polygyrus]